LLLALLDGDGDIARRFGAYMLLGGLLAGGPVVAILGRPVRMAQPERLTLIVALWVLLPFLAAIPIWDMSDFNYRQALFEAASGITTSGASVLNTSEVWPRPLLFYRAQLQWIGGFFALLSVILIAAPLGIGGLTRGRRGFGSGGDVMVGAGSPLATARDVAALYVVMTGLCTALLVLSGHRTYHALAFSMGAVSTGGFLPFDTTPDEALNVFGLFVVGVVLILSATSVYWLRNLITLKAPLTRQRFGESAGVIITIAVLAVIMVMRLAFVPGTLPLDLRNFAESLFNAASLVATSGLESRPGFQALLPMPLVLFIVLVGGSAYSTGGGLRQYRIGAMLSQSRSELDRLVFPSAVQQSHFGRARLDLPIMKAIWSFFAVVVVTLGLATFAVATAGMPFDAAFMAVVANFATAGPVYSPVWGGDMPWPRYSEMGDGVRLTLAATMVIGRLEVLALLALASFRLWRGKGLRV
jgi:trk system potassium uptake protein TrkH